MPKPLVTPLFLVCFVAASASVDAVADRAVPRHVRSSEPARTAAWTAFRDRHGPWRAVWRERTSTPHLAYGPAIPLAGFRDDRDGADRAVRGFVRDHSDLLGAPSLELASAVRGGRVWYLSYRRTLLGAPVLFEDWEFRVSVSGGLMAFRADAHPIDTPVANRRALSAAAAAARVGGEVASTRESPSLLPIESERGVEYRWVWPVEARNASSPGRRFLLVDATTGDVRWSLDRLRHAVSGTVAGAVHPELPSQPLVERPFANAWVMVGGQTVPTDASGGFSVDPGLSSVSVTSALRGPYCDVTRQDDVPSAFWSQPVINPGVAEIRWTTSNSIDAERDVFYHVNVAHDWLKRIDPDFVGIDYPMPCLVNLGGVCDAAWDGQALYFFSNGLLCPPLASMSDVIYHEYGHAWTDRLYDQLGQTWGLASDALHEGLSDVFSCFVRDDPVVGRDFLGTGTFLRRIDGDKAWPGDRGSARDAGLILSGALWALRESLGMELASRLAHFALYGKPDGGLDHGEAMAEYFVEMLVADDDNGNLDDGTPHAGAILSAFNARGIGTGWFLTILQPEPEDRPASGPYPISASIFTASPAGWVAGADLFYSLNGSAFASIPMTPVGAEFSAEIPAPRGSIVRYYVRAHDTMGGTKNDPPIEAGKAHLFFAGEATLVASELAELPDGWTVGDPGDGARTGAWTWGDPNGTTVGVGVQVQPEADAGNGIMCFFTGQAMVGASVSTNDVDGGVTTVRSPVLDASAAGESAVIEYWRWFTNEHETLTVDDRWRAWISNDLGATWVPIEDTMVPDNSWRRVAFFVRDYVTPNDQLVLRFAAEDVGGASLVEAAVDDVRVWRLETPVIPPPPPPAGGPLAIAAAPNPFGAGTRIALTLPRAGNARVTVLDVQGRRVRLLFDGPLAAGPNSRDWDGMDDEGRSVANGLYLVRLDFEGASAVRRIVRTE